jgi:hypothetical protein
MKDAVASLTASSDTGSYWRLQRAKQLTAHDGTSSRDATALTVCVCATDIEPLFVTADALAGSQAQSRYHSTLLAALSERRAARS